MPQYCGGFWFGFKAHQGLHIGMQPLMQRRSRIKRQRRWSPELFHNLRVNRVLANEDRRTDGRFLYIEPKVDDISVCYRISLAFKANPALFFCLPVTSGIHEILICNNFRPYEAPLDI